MLKETSLGQAAVLYIRDALDYGLPLDSYLIKLPIERGSTTAFLPVEVDELALTNFHAYAFWSPDETRASEARVEDEVINYLAADPLHYAIFEEVILSKDDKFTPIDYHQYFTKGDNVYHYVTSDTPFDDVRTIMQGSVNWRAVGVCFSSPRPINFLHQHEIDDDLFDIIVAGLDMMLIGAYDEGSWLIWRPPPLSNSPLL